MGKLVLRHPDGSLREIPLERERVTIGRRADNDICLPFPAVSGAHAAVVTVLDDSFLEDLNSTNGTLVNGKAITKHFLRDRDEIDIGRHTLVYVTGEYTEMLDPEPPAAAFHARGSIGSIDLEATLPPPRSEGARIDTGALFEPPDSPAIDAMADAPLQAPLLEILDGPDAGSIVAVGRDDFVIGRVGTQVAALRRTAEGFKLLRLEGDSSPRVNGTDLPEEGSLLAAGDEIEIAGTRLRYQPG